MPRKERDLTADTPAAIFIFTISIPPGGGGGPVLSAMTMSHGSGEADALLPITRDTRTAEIARQRILFYRREFFVPT